MQKRDIIVIGASAGGFEALKLLVSGLAEELEASIFIVWHMAPDVRGVLPAVLNRVGALPASHAVENEPVRDRRIYVAPPDHHLLLEKGTVRVTRGPKENRFRPAIDPLFRSAAYTYGPRVIGVIFPVRSMTEVRACGLLNTMAGSPLCRTRWTLRCHRCPRTR